MRDLLFMCKLWSLKAWNTETYAKQNKKTLEVFWFTFCILSNFWF
jgi:hypothetical protein